MRKGAVVSGRYRLLGQVRAGGMGTIWRARHLQLGTACVVKVLNASLENDVQARERFRREALTALRMHHPNVVRFFDYSVEKDGSAFLVMEHIVGADLSEFMRAAGLAPLPVALEIAHQALAALGALHACGIVHRDISPDNLILTEEPPDSLLVKVVDLGLAKQVSDRSLTETGTFVGKLKYGAPEQLGPLRNDAIDGRVDLYSLSVVLYQLLTGRLPFSSASPGGWVYAHLSEPPLPFEVSDPANRVPEDVRAAVMRGLEKDPRRRFPNAVSYLVALEGARQRAGRAGISDAIGLIRMLIARASATAAAPWDEPPGARATSRAASWLWAGGATLVATALWLSRPEPQGAAPTASAAPREAARFRGSAASAPALVPAPIIVPAASEGLLAVTASPDAFVTSIRRESDGAPLSVQKGITPWTLALPPGRYRVSAKFTDRDETAGAVVEIRGGSLELAHIRAKSFDLDAAVARYVP